MPRKSDGGSIHYEPGDPMGHYVVRLNSLPGRPYRHFPPSPRSPQQEERIRERARKVVEDHKAGRVFSVEGAEPAPKGETVSAWFERFCQHREKRGQTSVRDDRSRFKTHVEPELGSTPMAAVTREQVERFVAVLDAKVHAGALSWRTARNAWGLVSAMFSAARRSKALELRCRSDNPCLDVEPPDDGTKKAKTFLYPTELVQFAACERVPLRWRRMVVASVYLGTRAGELDALEHDDVDLDRGIVHVHRALDRSKKGGTKCTKTGSPRRFRMEPELLPMLAAMFEEARGQGRLFAPLKLTGRSEKLRMFLKRAGVTRAELYASSPTQKALGWHDLRATSATWMAVRGDEPLKIMQRLGHKNMSTTMLYVREAEQIRDGFGDVFPELPKAKLGAILPTDSAFCSATIENHRAGHGVRKRAGCRDQRDHRVG